MVFIYNNNIAINVDNIDYIKFYRDSSALFVFKSGKMIEFDSITKKEFQEMIDSSN